MDRPRTKSKRQLSSDADYREALAELARRYFESFCRWPRPLFPWVLVYVLPKEHPDGRVWLADKHSKVTYEGIVLRVWGTGRHERWYVEDGKDVAYVTKTQLQVGDCVCFPHFAGWPPNIEHDKEFRLVKEYQTNDVEDFIFAKVEHDMWSSYKQVQDAVEQVINSW